MVKVRQNIVISLLINFGVILLSAFGVLPPVTAVLVHNFAPFSLWSTQRCFFGSGMFGVRAICFNKVLASPRGRRDIIPRP